MMAIEELAALIGTASKLMTMSLDSAARGASTRWRGEVQRLLKAAISRYEELESGAVAEETQLEELRGKLVEELLRFELATGIVLDANGKYVPRSLVRRG